GPELFRAVPGRRGRVTADESAGRGGGVRAVRVHGPATPHLHVVGVCATAGRRDRRPTDTQGAPGAFHQVQDGFLVPAGLGGDERIVRVVLHRQLECVRERSVHPIQVVTCRAGTDVQVTRLFGPVAVGRCHLL